jgi:hypothetical protein
MRLGTPLVRSSRFEESPSAAQPYQLQRRERKFALTVPTDDLQQVTMPPAKTTGAWMYVTSYGPCSARWARGFEAAAMWGSLAEPHVHIRRKLESNLCRLWASRYPLDTIRPYLDASPLF